MEEEATEDPPRRGAAALRRSRRLATLLDEAVRVPGTNYRVGLDPLVGVLPVGGDALGLVLSLYPVVEAVRLGASRWTVARMIGNVLVDAAIGSVPVVGTLFDAVWKATDRNVRLLEGAVDDS